MSYRKSPTGQYQRKPAAWVTGYLRKDKYSLLRSGRYVPKSVEFVDLIVPARKDLQLPVDAEVKSQFEGPGLEKRLIVRVPKEGLKSFDAEGVPDNFFEEPQPKPRGPRTPTEYDKQIGTIRTALKKMCPTLSVKRGSGTAYGWIEISGSKDEFHNFTDEERKALGEFGLNAGGNFTVISPEDRKYYVEKANKILGHPI